MKAPFVLASALALLAAAPALASDLHLAQAQAPSGMGTGSAQVPGSMKTGDVALNDYVQKTAMTDMFEIQAGQLAQQKGQKPEVKQFGEQMVKDHTASSQKFKAAMQATSASVPMPAALDAKHQQMLQQLQNASGAEFDRLYIQSQVSGHREALQLQQAFIQSSTNNAQLKSFATEAAKLIQGHLSHVEQLAQNMGA